MLVLLPVMFAVLRTTSAALPIAPACGVERVSEDSPSCVNASGRLQICEHVVPGSGSDIAIELRNSGRLAHTWHVEVPPVHQGFPFHVVRGDLTGDGIDDVAVITLLASSNGRVINTYAVCAADGSDLERETECVTVQDYGKVGYFTRQPEARGCLLLQTAWRYGSEPDRGSGTYVVGRWLRFGRDGFVVDPWRPLVARRLLNGFSATVDSLPDDTHLAWFLDGHTRIVNCPDPLCRER